MTLRKSVNHEMQQRLQQRYAQFRSDLSLPYELKTRLSAPLFLRVPEKWTTSQHKLLVIGKETRGWSAFPEQNIETCGQFIETPNSVQALIKGYERFNFGELFSSTQKSPFWSTYKKLRGDLEKDVTGSILWTNLFRMALDQGSVVKNATQDEIETIYRTTSELLADEIAILAPRAVIFFTGPSYDDSVKRFFPGAALQRLPNHAIRSLARITHTSLPEHSYRTYHPKFLSYKKLLPAMISALCELIQQN